jgi:hypothetical protein
LGIFAGGFGETRGIPGCQFGGADALVDPRQTIA